MIYRNSGWDTRIKVDYRKKLLGYIMQQQSYNASTHQDSLGLKYSFHIAHVLWKLDPTLIFTPINYPLN